MCARSAGSVVVRNNGIKGWVDESTTVRGMMGRDCLRSDSSAAARRHCGFGRPLGSASAVARSRELGAASSARAIQGAWRETAAYRRRDSDGPGLVVAAVRLAFVPDGCSAGNGSPLAPSRLAPILAPQVATGPSADSHGATPADPTHGHREPALGRGEDCRRIAAEARITGLAAYGSQVHAKATARSPRCRSALVDLSPEPCQGHCRV